MAEKMTAIIVSRDEVLVREIKEKLLSLIDIRGILNDADTSYSFVKERVPRLLFLDIRDSPERGFSLASRVERFLPETLKFIISDSKNPDFILRSLKVGAADYILFPFEEDILTQVTTVLEKGNRREREGNVFVITSSKGGLGVTTLAVNLADHIHELTGGRVAVVDLKQQIGDAALFMGLDETYTLEDLRKDLPRLDEGLLFSSLVRHRNGFYVITAPEEINAAGMNGAEDTGRIFRILKEYLDYIIVDMAHEFTEQSSSVIDISDKVLLLTQQAVPAIKGTKKTLELLREVGYGEEKVKIINNRYEKGNEITPQDMEEVFNQKLFATMSNDFNTVTGAINKGELLSKNHGDSPVNGDIHNIASLLTGIQREGDEQTEKTLLKRVLQGVFKRGNE